MVRKPAHFDAKWAAAFTDRGVVDAYRHRPPYPLEIFDILGGLLAETPGHLLDVGCGTGDLARPLTTHATLVHAVDASEHMIERGKQLAGGDHPRLRWTLGRAEDVQLHPPYALITAGESVHWLDWVVVMPRFRSALAPGGYLAIVDRETEPDPWSTLGEIIERYRTDGGYQPFDMLGELEGHGLFRKVGERRTLTVPFTQSIPDFIESYHSRSGFSRERMGEGQAAAFDREARELLGLSHPAGVITLQVTGSVIWGFPNT